MKNVLTIAGSDSGGGAGIQADLKTFAAHQVFGMSVITAVTAQNTQGVFAVEDISPEVIGKQIDVIFEDIDVAAVKIGMVSVVATIEVIAERLVRWGAKNIVVDPVMVSKSGYDLLKPEAKEALIQKLFPLALIVTPNIPEAEIIAGMRITNQEEMEKACRVIHGLGPKNVLLKGGHLEGQEAVDLLYDGREIKKLVSRKIITKNTHGTGCTFSSALAANLAKGFSVWEAAIAAKEYITTAIEHSLSIGKGVGPTHHFYTLYKKAGLL